MPVRPIVLYAFSPELLRKQSEPVQGGLDEAGQLLVDLRDTLQHHENGVGLAAPQIGVHKRAIAVRLAASPRGPYRPPVGIVNPVIVEAACELPDADGCLSFPGLYAETVRPHFLRLQGIDEQGRSFEWTLEGFNAVVVHHEVDHLDGVLFIDRASSPDKLYTESDGRGRRARARAGR
jgi:peptide deformylase